MLKIESNSFVKEHGLLACIQCGKCTGGCPMAIKTRLNPRRLIYQLLVANDGFNLENSEEIWDCTTCSTCTGRCPKLVNPMEALIALRSAFVEKGRVHPNVKTALESTFRYGNPLTLPRQERAAWAEGLPVKSFEPGTRYLFYVGCTPSYDPQAQVIPRSLARLLERAGVDYGILGTDETCCGSEIRRLGELGLFEMMVEEAQEQFQSLEIHQIFTASPHCFHTFSTDYPQNGRSVQHYTQLLAALLEQGRLAFRAEFARTVTYHDPCYLGKHHGIFDEPRAVLQSIPGLRLVEMERSRHKSLCCEGGGGRMWLEGTNPGTRLARMRVQEALEVGAEVLATACPFCLLTLKEAVNHLNVAEKIQVMDVAEIAARALGG